MDRQDPWSDLVLLDPWSDTAEVITEVWDKEFLSSRIIEPWLQESYRFYPILHMVPYNFPNN